MPHYPTNRPPLQPAAFVPLPLGAVKPQGWLRRQLEIQAAGLTGHLDEFWPDLGPDNMWLGGGSEGWERGPYYLDGLVPLAYLLDDERLLAKVRRWIEPILASQQPDGWIGPVQAPNHPPYDPWPVFVLLKVLTQYYEASGDERAFDAIASFCRYLRDHIDERPLFEWGRFRWADLLVSVYWLYNRTGDAWLLDLAAKLHQQGYDWRTHFANFRYTERTRREECTLETHVVNSAMAIKAPGIWWQQSGDPADKQSVYETLQRLDHYHGQATGMFSGDEHYAGREPSQGTELCAVVEEMYSLEQLLAIVGDPAFGDLLERIAYNALPATCTPDMWAHQYDQQVNQVLCTLAPRQWTNNTDSSNLYGLEPHFGCCTANMHQGWPKLVANLVMATPDNGAVLVAYGPCEADVIVGDGTRVRLRIETDYPFDGRVRLTVHTDESARFPLLLRIPAWADGARVVAAGDAAETATPGEFYRIEREWKDGDVVELDLPLALRVERGYQETASVVRGPLLFGLRLGEDWRVLRGELPHADWEVHPTTAWNYALALDPAHLESSISVVRHSSSGTVPFATDAAPVELRAQGRRLLSWDLAQNSAGPLPPSPVRSAEPLEDLTLIPYGSTGLRIAAFPVLEEDTGE